MGSFGSRDHIVIDTAACDFAGFTKWVANGGSLDAYYLSTVVTDMPVFVSFHSSSISDNCLNLKSHQLYLRQMDEWMKMANYMKQGLSIKDPFSIGSAQLVAIFDLKSMSL